MRFLFRLWESENEESWDQLSVCTQVLWNFMVYYNPEIFSDFINYLLDYTSYNISDNNLGMMLEAFYISVSELEITQSTNYAEIPTFSWISNGKDVYFNELHPYSNNKFSLQFFDVNDNLIFETNYIYSSYYTLSENEWNQLLSPAFLKYRVIIKSYATYGYETGPYYSSIYSFNKPNSASYSISLNNSRYYEKRIAIAQGTNWTFNVTFDNSGDKLIQTFGNKNTKMWLYDYDGSTLISSDDDSGYNYNAFIFSNLVSGRNYFLIVNLYNQNDYGMVKLSIISVGGFKNPNDLNITSYSNIYNISGYQNYNLYSYVSQYNSMIVTWTPNSSGFYSINLDSEFDNFLYVINSLSSNQLIEDVDYNDDEYYYDEEDYNLNAKLIGYYEANITYLIIFTQNNPANSLNVGIDDDIILSIYKTN